MAKIRITESQLRQIVEESVNSIINESYINENEIDEGFWNNVKSGLKGAFGADAKRAGGAIKGAYNNMKGAVQGAYNSAVQGVQNGYRNMQQGINQRVDAFKANYKTKQDIEKIKNVIATLEELKADGVIDNQNTTAIIGHLNNLLSSDMTAKRTNAQNIAANVGKKQ